jgi:hypothetical protein
MAVYVKVISGENCDHCKKVRASILLAIETRRKGFGWEQVFIHRSCLTRLLDKLIELKDGPK